MLPKRTARALLAVVTLAGCTGRAASEPDRLVVFAAGSLARPLRAALDTFAAQTNTRIDLESAGSLETARKLSELGKIPDVVALADEEVFPQLLMPRFTTWYARFARNRMVIAHTARSRYADSLSERTWRNVLTRADVQVGRADPDVDPAGYRTLLVFQLAERHYHDPGFAARLLKNAPVRNMRAKSAELVALLQAGELDYAWSYESVAQAAGLRYLTLPSGVDLGADADSTAYAAASVNVLGASRGDTITMTGRSIHYAVSIPTDAPHRKTAEQFVVWLLGERGRAILRSEHLDALDGPQIIGTGVPSSLRLHE
jgi:molybdate/tungstate transport system substrate-binding protein